MTREALPVVDPNELPDRLDRHPADVHGVILAAGTSSRYGAQNKLLEPLDGTPLIRHVAETIISSRVTGTTVIVGHERDRVREALSDLDIEIKDNPEYEAGQSTSVRVGVQAASDHGTDAVIVVLGDMPLIETRTIDLLIDAYESRAADIIAAGYEGKRGNPVLFDSRYFDSLSDISGDTGGRSLLLNSKMALCLETGDPGVVTDIDRPSDHPERGE